MFHWLLFRLMFLSGVVKLASGDATWWSWQALRYHYETQPLPPWTAWYFHQLPAWFHSLSAGFVFWAELVAPFLIWLPRRPRMVGFASMALLQVLIALSGNYGFFNLLALVLCLTLVEDRDWARRDRSETLPPQGGGLKGVVLALIALVLVLVSTAEAVNGLWIVAPTPAALERLRLSLAPFRSANRYGLFAVMTTERPEIIVEGSHDGLNWRPYEFRWKPGDLSERPRFTTPHMPRLDWQMWFAALGGDCRSQPWFLRFEGCLLEPSPEVLALLRSSPFDTQPPSYLRARLFDYHFTAPGSRTWWRRREIRLYCPPLRHHANLDPTAPRDYRTNVPD